MNAMNAMKRLTIENFQSHKKTVVEFAPAGGLTVIVGPSDTGKTVIIRALRWLFYNTPQGMEFVRTGASFVRVTVEYESGHKVIRERTVSTNRYKIIAPGAEAPEVFEGFGNDVPLEVQKITGVRQVRIGDDTFNLNLSEQLDGPFLGTKQISSPARAKVLGKLAGTEEIDLAAKDLGTDIYRRNRDIDRLKTEIAGLTESVKKYDYLPALKTKIKQLQELLDAVKTAEERKITLENLRSKLTTVLLNISECDRVIARWQGLDEAYFTSREVEATIRRKDILLSLAAQLAQAEYYLETCQKTISRWHGVDEAEQVLIQTETFIQRQKNLIVLSRQLTVAEAEIKNAQKTIAQYMYLPEAEDMVNLVDTNLPKLKRVKELQAKLQNTDSALSQIEKTLGKWAKVCEAERAQNEVTTLIEKQRTLTIFKQQLRATEKNIETARQDIVVFEQRVSELEGAYRDALLAAGVCPTCGTELTPETLKKAV